MSTDRRRIVTYLDDSSATRLAFIAAELRLSQSASIEALIKQYQFQDQQLELVCAKNTK